MSPPTPQREALIPPDEFAPTTQGEMAHRHNSGGPCVACYILRLQDEAAQIRTLLAADDFLDHGDAILAELRVLVRPPEAE